MEPAGRALEPLGRALEPSGRALDPDERAPEPAERALEPAGRPFEASWEARSHLGGPVERPGEGDRKRTDKETDRTERPGYVVVL